MGSSGNEWRPLLHGNLARQAFDTAESIVEAVREERCAGDFSLGSGAAGHAVLHAYRSLVRSTSAAVTCATQELSRAIDAIATTRTSASLFSGFLGVAWAAELLTGNESDEAPDPNEEIDLALLRLVGRRPWSADYDLVSGLVGFGVYALERLPRSAASLTLVEIVDRLDELGERCDDGITWHTPVQLLAPSARKIHGDGWYDLGVAHGIPGVIGFLGAVCAAGIAVTKARPLLEGAASWLLARRSPEPAETAFGFSVDRSNRFEPARTAWCYGDPGIAATLLLASRALAQPAWSHAATEIARRAMRRPRGHTGVFDAGLCHGAAGLGHLYNRIFQATGEADFGLEARYWIERAVAYRGRDGIAGYRRVDPDGSLADDSGLLTGASGVALALFAAASSVEPVWDRALLLSSPTVN